MFGRSRKEDTVQEEVEEEARPQLYDESELWQIPGPREEYEVDTSVDYVDLGSLRIPAVPGMQIRAQAGEDGQSIIRIMLVLASSGLQFSIAAAPRSGGTWDELRPQIRAAYEEGGSTVRERHTRYGDELEVDEAVTLMTSRSSSIGLLSYAATNLGRDWIYCHFIFPIKAQHEFPMFKKLIDRAVKRLSLSREDIDANDEKQSREERGRLAVADVQDRQKAILFGTIQSVTYYPENIRPLIDATLFDGTGTIVLRWPGRSDIPGMHAGVHLEVEGTIGVSNGVKMMTNPLYRLIAEDNVE